VILCTLYMHPNKTRNPEKPDGYEYGYGYNHSKPDGYEYAYVYYF